MKFWVAVLFCTSLLFGAEPHPDPSMPGWLQVRFKKHVASLTVDQTISDLGFTSFARSGTLSGTQWRRIKVEPFTEVQVAVKLRARPDVLEVREVRLSEIYPRDRGARLEAKIILQTEYPENAHSLQSLGHGYFTAIEKKLCKQYGSSSITILKVDACSLSCTINVIGSVTHNKEIQEVIECTFLLAESRLILVTNGFYYSKRYHPNPATEVVKPFLNESQKGLEDFSSSLLGIARSVFINP